MPFVPEVEDMSVMQYFYRIFSLVSVIIAATWAMSKPVSAEKLTWVGNEYCDYKFQGEIERGDLRLFKELGWNLQSLCLDSKGGNYVEAIEIAEYIFSRARTVIMDGAECLSACAFIFMAGSEFEEGVALNRKMHYRARLGVHAPYIIPRSSGPFTSNDLIIAYSFGLDAVARVMEIGVDQFGYLYKGRVMPRALIIQMLRHDPFSFFEINRLEIAAALDIDVFGLHDVKIDQSSACNSCSYNELRSEIILDEDPYSRLGNLCERVFVDENDNITTFYFSGFGGEGGGWCVAQIRESQNSTKKLFRSIGTVWDEDLPLSEDQFREVPLMHMHHRKTVLGPR